VLRALADERRWDETCCQRRGAPGRNPLLGRENRAGSVRAGRRHTAECLIAAAAVGGGKRARGSIVRSLRPRSTPEGRRTRLRRVKAGCDSSRAAVEHFQDSCCLQSLVRLVNLPCTAQYGDHPGLTSSRDGQDKVGGTGGRGADQRHVADENTQQLRRLADAGSAQYSAELQSMPTASSGRKKMPSICRVRPERSSTNAGSTWARLKPKPCIS